MESIRGHRISRLHECAKAGMDAQVKAGFDEDEISSSMYLCFLIYHDLDTERAVSAIRAGMRSLMRAIKEKK